jgi:glutathione synthase/RimK-type ligase-like ATP-grasp enzyme
MSSAAAEAFEKSITRRYSEVSATIGFEFRTVRASEIVASCLGKPVLRYRGTDLLSRRQCFIVEDLSVAPQGLAAMRAIYRTVEASSSILLNRSFTGQSYLEVDKLALLQHASNLGIAVPKTIAVPAGRYARRAVVEVTSELGEGPYIVKPREMGGGFGVLRVDTADQLNATLDIVSQTGVGYIVQPFIPHIGDMRVFVVDGEVVTSLTRRPKPDGYLANFSQGGTIEVNADHLQVAEQCVRIATSLNAEFIGVDWLMTDSGPMLNEWCTAQVGFTLMPEPERTLVVNAFFGWIKRKFDEG